jgi:hypothetical protein
VRKKARKAKKDVGSNRYDLNVFGFAYSVECINFACPSPLPSEYKEDLSKMLCIVGDSIIAPSLHGDEFDPSVM